MGVKCLSKANREYKESFYTKSIIHFNKYTYHFHIGNNENKTKPKATLFSKCFLFPGMFDHETHLVIKIERTWSKIRSNIIIYFYFFIFFQAKNIHLSKHSLWGVIHLRLVNFTRIVALCISNGCRAYVQLLKTVKKL